MKKQWPRIPIQEETDWNSDEQAFIEQVIEVYEERRAQEHHFRDTVLFWALMVIVFADAFLNVQFGLFLSRLGGH